MKELAYINGKDMWTTWGARLEKGAYEALLTPPALKPHIENSSRVTDGTQVMVHNPRVQERDVSLVITIRGKDENDYLTRYKSFVDELQNGWVRLKIPTLKTEYNLLYESCTKFGNYGLKYGKFSLRFREPNPKNRIAL